MMNRISLICLMLVAIIGCNSNSGNTVSPNGESSDATSSNNISYSSIPNMYSSATSLIPSSSSSGLCENTYTNGSMIDCRDGQAYAIVAIGSQTWMAENLKYMPTLGASWCYENDENNCNIYGRLYAWTTAQQVCPNGWHLASLNEWLLLKDFSGGWSISGGALKANSTLWWFPGTNAYGFSALPSGRYDAETYYEGSYFYGKGSVAYWWTSTGIDMRKANSVMIDDKDYIYDDIDVGTPNYAATVNATLMSTKGYAVRCVLDTIAN